jgi:Ser/Thr protein kinase RdoA (MazF antagonist)
MNLANVRFPRPGKLYNMVNALCRPPRIDQTEVGAVLAAYDLGPLEGCRRPAIGSSRSGNLILDFGAGKKVLKRYKSSMSLEGITYEHSVLKHLAVRSFPSPRLVLDSEGETCLETDGKYYALFDFIPGFRYTDYFVRPRRKRFFLAEAGKTLARYHRAMDGFVPAGRKLDGFMPDGQRRWLDRRWYLDRFAEYKALFEAKEDRSEGDQFFVDHLDRLEQCYVDVDRKLEEHSSSLPKVVNHGDYGPHNLFFDEQGMVTVLDFECVHLNLRATEIIKAVRFFAGREVGFDNGAAQVFLAAYSASCPLTVSEIEMMADIARLTLLQGLVYHLRGYFDSANLLRLRYARNSVAWIDWLGATGDELVTNLLAFTKVR